MAGEHGFCAARAHAVPTLGRPGGHYSHGISAGGLLFVSGQLPITEAGAKLADAPFEHQAAQVLANVEAVLLAAGSAIAQLVQVRVYLADIADWRTFDAIYARWAGAARPARAVIPAGPLHFGLKIEIEAVAIAGEAVST
jgi:reactive intermediate/imine deaminase